MITTGVSSLHRYSVLGNWGSRTHEVTGFLSPVIGTQSVNFKAIFRAAPIDQTPSPGRPDLGCQPGSLAPAFSECGATAQSSWLLPIFPPTATFTELREFGLPPPKCRLPLRFQTKLCPLAVGIRGPHSNHLLGCVVVILAAHRYRDVDLSEEE